MRLLLDTHILLWSAGNLPGLSPPARAAIEDFDNEIFFSAVSIWEIAITLAQGRAEFQADPTLLRDLALANGYAELQISSDHGVLAGSLPPLHKDPFDRLLIGQAIAEDMTLVTIDTAIIRYPGLRTL